MNLINFKLVTPEHVVYESDIDQLTCPTQMGEVTILPNHIPLVANLVPGEMRIVKEGQDIFFAIHGGFLEVRQKNEVVILADAAEHVEEIDVKRAEEAREKAKKIMEEKVQDAEKFAESQAALERSLVRIKAARRKKYKDVGKQVLS